MRTEHKTVSIGTKMSEAEAGLFRDLATARGTDGSALLRQLALREVAGGKAGNSDHGLAEKLTDLGKRFDALMEALDMMLEEQEASGKMMTWDRFREICGEAKKLYG